MLYCCAKAFQPLYNFYAYEEGAIYKKVEFHHCPNCKQAVYREKVLRYDNALIYNTFKGQKAEKMFKRAYSNRLIFKEKIKQGTKVKNNWFYGSFKNSNSKDEKGRVIQIQTKKNFNDETVAILGKQKLFMDKINRLICLLIAIAESAKAVHYSVKGESAYSKHLLADKIHNGLYGFIDNLKETFFLAGNEPLLSAKEYLNIAADFTIKLTDDDKENFISLQKLIVQTLELIEGVASALTRGEQSLMDDIAKDLQGKLGLVNLQIEG